MKETLAVPSVPDTQWQNKDRGSIKEDLCFLLLGSDFQKRNVNGLCLKMKFIKATRFIVPDWLVIYMANQECL
jgi:hypothetical protein